MAANCIERRSERRFHPRLDARCDECGMDYGDHRGDRCPEELKQQPQSPEIYTLVQADLVGRDMVGRATYGKSLHAHDGRDTMRDAYEEALDLTQYLRKLLWERDGK